MTSPMMDPPEHLRIPLTKEGYGPALGATIDHWGCWCADGVDCMADSQIWGLDFDINRRVGQRMSGEAIKDVIALAVPEGVDPNDAGFMASLRVLAEKFVWAQYRGRSPDEILFEPIAWLVTQKVEDVEAFQPAHECATCRAANDQMLAFLREHPTRWVAMGNMAYREVWTS